MDERVLVKSKSISTKNTAIRYFIVPVVVFAIVVLYYVLNINGSQQVSTYMGGINPGVRSYDRSLFDYLISTLIFETSANISIVISIVLYIGIASLIWGIVNFMKYKSMSLTVTDTRIYGVSSFGKRVDLPLRTVQSVSASGKRDIHLMTPSGKIVFGNFENADELFHTISKLLVEHQG